MTLVNVRKSPLLAPFTPLGTDRLSLVALSLEHAPFVFAYASDPEISRLSAMPRHETLADSRRFVARCLVAYAQGGHYEWGLVRRTDHEFLGCCGFGNIDFGLRSAELSFVLSRPHWGHGYATEAAAALIHFGFARLGLWTIQAEAFDENARSARVLSKLGLRYHGHKLMSREQGPARAISFWQIERNQWMPETAQRLMA